MTENGSFDSANRATALDPQDARGRREVGFTPERQERFLDALRDGYSVTASAKRAGVGVRTCYNHKEIDPDFAREWDDALDEGTDLYEDRMRELAFDKNGFLPTMATLKARRPDKWADKQVGISRSPGINITINVPPTEQLPQELRRIVEGEIQIIEEGE